jgi:murein DD-endopeptidase MepM/ murein hydrolase activator NlpD
MLLLVALLTHGITQSELPPPVPQIDIINGQAGALVLNAQACAGPLMFIGKQWRCRPDHTLILAVPPETTLFGPESIIDARGNHVATINVGMTVFREDRFPASSAGKPAPPGRLAQDREKVDAAYSAHRDPLWESYHVSTPLRAPLNVPYRLVTPYGAQRYYGKNGPTPHYAVDLGAKNPTQKSIAGAAVATISSGVVVLAESLWSCGNTVIVYHGDNVYSTHCHLSFIAVKAGDQVPAGTRIGDVGSTGAHTSGPHLHLMLRVNGIPVDPMTSIPNLNRGLHMGR